MIFDTNFPASPSTLGRGNRLQKSRGECRAQKENYKYEIKARENKVIQIKDL
jgi:hypothetical protein